MACAASPSSEADGHGGQRPGQPDGLDDMHVGCGGLDDQPRDARVPAGPAVEQPTVPACGSSGAGARHVEYQYTAPSAMGMQPNRSPVRWSSSSPGASSRPGGTWGATPRAAYSPNRRAQDAPGTARPAGCWRHHRQPRRRQPARSRCRRRGGAPARRARAASGRWPPCAPSLPEAGRPAAGAARYGAPRPPAPRNARTVVAAISVKR